MLLQQSSLEVMKAYIRCVFQQLRRRSFSTSDATEMEEKCFFVAWLTCDLKERAGSVMMLRFSGRSDYTHINAEGEAVAGGEKEIWTKDDVLHFISVTDDVTK